MHLFTLQSTHMPHPSTSASPILSNSSPFMNRIFPIIVRQLPLGSCFIMCYLFKAGLVLRPNVAPQKGEMNPIAGHKDGKRCCSNCERTQMKTKLSICYLCVGILVPAVASSTVGGLVSMSS